MKYLHALKYCAWAGIVAALIAFATKDDNFLSRAFSTPEQPQSVVRVHVEHDNGESEHGSGVLVRADLILTNHHVVRDRGKDGVVTVEFKGGLVREATVIKESDLWDVALLQFNSVLLIPAKPAKNAAVKHQEVTICGFPHNGDYDERSGRVVGFRSPNRKADSLWFVVSTKCESGMSGGPVFDANGDVVGILFGTLRFANCVGLDALKEFLDVQPIPRQDRANYHTN